MGCNLLRLVDHDSLTNIIYYLEFNVVTNSSFESEIFSGEPYASFVHIKIIINVDNKRPSNII